MPRGVWLQGLKGSNAPWMALETIVTFSREQEAPKTRRWEKLKPEAVADVAVKRSLRNEAGKLLTGTFASFKIWESSCRMPSVPWPVRQRREPSHVWFQPRT